MLKRVFHVDIGLFRTIAPINGILCEAIRNDLKADFSMVARFDLLVCELQILNLMHTATWRLNLDFLQLFELLAALVGRRQFNLKLAHRIILVPKCFGQSRPRNWTGAVAKVHCPCLEAIGKYIERELDFVSDGDNAIFDLKLLELVLVTTRGTIADYSNCAGDRLLVTARVVRSKLNLVLSRLRERVFGGTNFVRSRKQVGAVPEVNRPMLKARR
mmetsp:Transcript_11275/g.30338  ORF Transcript_11275/g.30338 Transcript_11275/m.30338 type:complete len:216 (+) Transcript_11275:412-1059(+)